VMRIVLRSLLTLVLLHLLASFVWATEIDLLKLGLGAKLPNSVYISPKTYTAIDLQGPFGEIAPPSGETGWVVTQWNFPGVASQALSTIVNCQGNCTDGQWELSSPDGRQTLRASSDSAVTGTVYHLIQDTYGASFSDCAYSEVSLNLEPIASWIYLDHPSGFIPFSERPTLGDADEYHVAFQVNIAESTHRDGVTCQSPYNLHSVIIGFFLHNFVTDPFGDNTKDHTISYQLVVRDSRLWDNDGSWYQNNGENGGPWGVNDNIEVYEGLKQQTPGSTYVVYDIDFKARLEKLLGEVPDPPSDPEFADPNNWHMTGLYLSSAVHGEGKGDLRFKKPRLYAVE